MTSSNKLASELEKFVVRLPPGMREKIANAAAESSRSMNSEIVHRLEQSFLGENDFSAQQMAATQSPLREAINSLLDELSMARSLLSEANSNLAKHVNRTKRTK